MQIRQERKIKAKVVWDQPANPVTVSNSRSWREGEVPTLSLRFRGEDDPDEFQSAFTIIGTAEEFAWLKTSIESLLKPREGSK